MSVPIEDYELVLRRRDDGREMVLTDLTHVRIKNHVREGEPDHRHATYEPTGYVTIEATGRRREG